MDTGAFIALVWSFVLFGIGVAVGFFLALLLEGK